jgi:hypothetical protein
VDDSAAPTTPVIVSRLRLRQFWRSAYLIIVGGWLGWILLGADFSGAGLFAGMQPQVLLFASAWVLLPLGLGALWWSVIWLCHETRLPWRVLLRIQALAWGGRYLPGKAGLWLAKLSLAGRYQLDWRKLGHSLVIEQGGFVLGGAIVASLLMPWDRVIIEVERHFESSRFGTDSALFVNAFAFSLSVAFLCVFAALIWFAGRSFKIGTRIRIRYWLALICGYCLLHVILGLALYPVMSFAFPDGVQVLGVSGVISALAFANIAGVVVLFAPAGLGVREGGLALVLALVIDYPQALAFAAFLRLVTFVADTVFAVAGWIIGRD